MTCRGEAGSSLLEVLVAVALVATVTSIGAPLMADARDAQDGRQAAVFLAGRFRATRQLAVLTGRHAALVFDARDATWTFRPCVDGNDDGVLRSDVVSGVDRCRGEALPLEAWFSRTVIGRAPDVPGPSGRTDDPVVAFGSSGIASFSPLGTSSSGSVTLRTRGGRHFAVRVAGVTGRVRMLRYSPEARRWQEF